MTTQKPQRSEDFSLPHEKFSNRQDPADWVGLIYNLALRALPLRDIAGKVRCHPETLRDSAVIMETIRAGHADHRLTIEAALFADATADAWRGEDPSERADIRKARTAALRMIKSTIDRKEEFVSPVEVEKIRRLSDEELDAELQKFVAQKKQSL